MESFEYPLLDADTHYFEPEDTFTRHIEPRYRERALQAVEQNGERVVIADGKPFGWFSPFVKLTVPPETMNRFLRGPFPADLSDLPEELKEGLAQQKDAPEDPPWISNRDARLAWMDERGIELALLFPTGGLAWMRPLEHDRDLLMAHVRAFNRWLEEDWGFDYERRLLAAPMFLLEDVDQAVAELEWALARGARVLNLFPGPHQGMSPGHPRFDPFWARVNEARTPVAIHVGNYTRYEVALVEQWGERFGDLFEMSPLQGMLTVSGQMSKETIAALVLYNLFGRFPDINIMSVENHSDWVAPLCTAMDRTTRFAIGGDWPGGRLKESPIEIVRRHLWVCPFQYEDIQGLERAIGSERILFGSDYPHPEGIAEPGSFADWLEGCDEKAVRNIMSDNLRTLLAKAG